MEEIAKMPPRLKSEVAPFSTFEGVTAYTLSLEYLQVYTRFPQTLRVFFGGAYTSVVARRRLIITQVMMPLPI